MLFIPNLSCTVTKHGGLDLYGQPLPGVSYKEKCAIVKIANKILPTSVRADSSASRGAAQEMIVDAELLLVATTKAQLNDFVDVSGFKLRVVGKFPRYSVTGKLDHYQLLCNIWES